MALLPVELILDVGSGAGFAMVFALLLSAIIWNLGTWYLGLPASSSHTLIGSIIGVGLMNSLLLERPAVRRRRELGQGAGHGMALLISPLVGFVAAALLLLAQGRDQESGALQVARRTRRRRRSGSAACWS